MFFISFLYFRSQPRGDDSVRPWSQLSWRQRALHRTTRQYPPPRRWWTASLSSPSKRPASPLCSSVWQKYRHDISCHLRKNFVYTTRIFSLFEMPYLSFDSFITFRLSGTEASEVEPWNKSLASLQLLLSWVFDCVGSVLQVCVGLPFVYILTSVLWCQAHLSFLSVNLLNIWSPAVALSVGADCLFWELCFIMFAIFPFPHMIAIFPSFLYLFSHPPLFQK